MDIEALFEHCPLSKNHKLSYEFLFYVKCSHNCFCTFPQNFITDDEVHECVMVKAPPEKSGAEEVFPDAMCARIRPGETSAGMFRIGRDHIKFKLNHAND